MGRFSRYPAIDRGPVREEPAEVIPAAPEPEVEAEVEEVAVVGAFEAEAIDFDEDLDAMTTNEVLEWVGDDPERRAYALDTEETGKARKALLRKLRGA